jgi:hypothetical protein
MALKSMIDALTDVPEALREHYTPRDGKFVLAAEGLVPAARVAEFRDNNIALTKKLEELTTRFDGVDPDVFRDLSAKALEARGKKLIDAGKVDELVAERVGAMKTEHDKVVTGLTAKQAALTGQLEGLVIDGALRDAASKAGVRPTAIDDVLLRGRSVFKLQDGRAVPMDGDKPIYGKSGDPMPIAEWVGGLSASAPHLFEASTGGGARGASPGGGAAGTIARDDAKGFLANLDKIAKGEVKVA